MMNSQSVNGLFSDGFSQEIDLLYPLPMMLPTLSTRANSKESRIEGRLVLLIKLMKETHQRLFLSLLNRQENGKKSGDYPSILAEKKIYLTNHLRILLNDLLEAQLQLSDREFKLSISISHLVERLNLPPNLSLGSGQLKLISPQEIFASRLQRVEDSLCSEKIIDFDATWLLNSVIDPFTTLLHDLLLDQDEAIKKIEKINKFKYIFSNNLNLFLVKIIKMQRVSCNNLKILKAMSCEILLHLKDSHPLAEEKNLSMTQKKIPSVPVFPFERLPLETVDGIITFDSRLEKQVSRFVTEIYKFIEELIKLPTSTIGEQSETYPDLLIEAIQNFSRPILNQLFKAQNLSSLYRKKLKAWINFLALPGDRSALLGHKRSRERLQEAVSEIPAKRTTNV